MQFWFEWRLEFRYAEDFCGQERRSELLSEDIHSLQAWKLERGRQEEFMVGSSKNCTDCCAKAPQEAHKQGVRPEPAPDVTSSAASS